MKFEFESRGGKEFQEKLGRLAGTMKPGVMQKAMQAACLRVIRHSKMFRFRRGAYDQAPVPGILTTRSGGAGLMGSINWKLEWRGKEIMGHVGSALPYARIHELGGRAGRGGMSRLRPRPYLGPALKAQEHNIDKDFNDALVAAIRGAGLK